jgi:hypothetical protein
MGSGHGKWAWVQGMGSGHESRAWCQGLVAGMGSELGSGVFMAYVQGMDSGHGTWVQSLEAGH